MGERGSVEANGGQFRTASITGDTRHPHVHVREHSPVYARTVASRVAIHDKRGVSGDGNVSPRENVHPSDLSPDKISTIMAYYGKHRSRRQPQPPDIVPVSGVDQRIRDGCPSWGGDGHRD